MDADALIGTWQLESWKSGELAPFGERPRGTLVYTVGGTMISCFMSAERPQLGVSLEALHAFRRYWLGLASEKPQGEEEVKQRFLRAAFSFNAYAGRYSVEGARVHHDVEVALFPEWVGRRLTRTFEIRGERLTLSFESDALVWRRSGRGDRDAAL